MQSSVIFKKLINQPTKSRIDLKTQSIKPGVIVDFDFYAARTALYSIMEFSKPEDKPRNGGWYYWYGYKISKSALPTTCDID